MSGLMFPKQVNKKKRKHHAKESIMHNERYCYLCMNNHGIYNSNNLHRHHCMHGTANRRLAEEDGLFINVCLDCHEVSKQAIHNNHDTDLFVMQQAQQAYEEKIGSREEFIMRYGKSYL